MNHKVPAKVKPGRKPGAGKVPGSGGSRAGRPNKSTANAREAIARFVDGNADKLQGWLDDIAADEKQGPREAFRCLLDVMEYHVPKLARTEHTGDGGGPVKQSLTVMFVKP